MSHALKKKKIPFVCVKNWIEFIEYWIQDEDIERW